MNYCRSSGFKGHNGTQGVPLVNDAESDGTRNRYGVSHNEMPWYAVAMLTEGEVTAGLTTVVS